MKWRCNRTANALVLSDQQFNDLPNCWIERWRWSRPQGERWPRKAVLEVDFGTVTNAYGILAYELVVTEVGSRTNSGAAALKFFTVQ